jgi:hypothetical protein
VTPAKTGALKGPVAPPSMAETFDQFSKLKLSFEGDTRLEELLTKFEVHATGDPGTGKSTAIHAKVDSIIMDLNGDEVKLSS